MNLEDIKTLRLLLSQLDERVDLIEGEAAEVADLVLEFNLAKNKVINYPIREVDLIEVQSEILDSALSMQSLLFDKPGNMARQEDFSPTDDEETCRRCSFRGVCSDSLS